MIQKPLISVIIPVKGRINVFKEAIESIYNQTYKNFEIIVSETSPEKETETIIENFKNKGLNITHLKNTDDTKGISYSRNRAIEISNGEYITFLDSDDLWYPKKLELQLQKYEQSPNLGLLYHDVISFDNNRKAPDHNYFYFNESKPYKGKCFLNLYTSYNIIPTSSVMTKKEVLEKIGLFDENLSANEDRDLWIRISQKYDIDYIDQPLGKYRYNAQNICLTPGLMNKGIEKVLEKYKDYYNQLISE